MKNLEKKPLILAIIGKGGKKNQTLLY